MPTKTKQTTTPKPVAHRNRAPQTAGQERYLRPTIDLISTAVAEMLSTGTSEGALDNLIQAALEHVTRREYERGIGVDYQQIVRDRVATLIARDAGPWRRDVIAQWREGRRSAGTAAAATTITERIRQNARDVLESQLDSFLGFASPEEVRFLSDVMSNWDSRKSAGSNGYAELYLGMAFECQLEQPRCYIRVPERMVGQVEAYVEALRAVDDKAVA